MRHNLPERFEIGVFTISLDFELQWGTIDRSDRQNFRKLCMGERERVVDGLLELFAEFQMPATWCTVGHLFLDRCDAGDAYHKALRQPERAKDPHLLLDPHSSEAHEGTFYGRKLVNRIRACPGQEVGAHSFTHLPFTDPMCTREVASGELSALRLAARAMGLPLHSFAFPRNQVAHVDLLVKYGYSIFRGKDATWYEQADSRGWRHRLGHLWDVATAATPPTVMPVWHPAGIWEIPGSMLYTPARGVRGLVPIGFRVARACKGLGAAARNGRVFHLWFHPTDLMPRPEAMLAGLRQVMRRADRLRDAGKLEFKSMHGLEESLSGRLTRYSEEVTAL